MENEVNNMFYIKLDELFNITYVSSEDTFVDKYNLVFYSSDLYLLLVSAGIKNFKLNTEALLKDLVKWRDIRLLFNDLNNNFEHLLIYLDFNGDRKKLNDVITSIVLQNCTYNLTYLITRGKLYYLEGEPIYLNLDSLIKLNISYDKNLFKNEIIAYNNSIIDYTVAFYNNCVKLVTSSLTSNDLIKNSKKFIYGYNF